MNFIAYLKTLNPEDWNVKATDKWTVKDVVAHIIGWIELDIASLERTDEADTLPWRQKGFDVNDYNAKSVKKYTDNTPNELIVTFVKLDEKRTNLIQEVGIENIKKDKELYYYLFEDGNNKHTEHHWKQIREALDK